MVMNGSFCLTTRILCAMKSK